MASVFISRMRDCSCRQPPHEYRPMYLSQNQYYSQCYRSTKCLKSGVLLFMGRHASEPGMNGCNTILSVVRTPCDVTVVLCCVGTRYQTETHDYVTMSHLNVGLQWSSIFVQCIKRLRRLLNDASFGAVDGQQCPSFYTCVEISP